MNCQWDKLLAILPPRLRQNVDRLGRETMQELRLRRGAPPRLHGSGGITVLPGEVTREDLAFVVNTASHYSPWAATTAARGYLTAPGGHRIGLGGECVVQKGSVTAVGEVSSLCIRVARCFPGIGEGAPMDGSLLILGPPGAGKTTLLRDLIRLRSIRGQCVAVVDEREELFPGSGFPMGPNTDVLTGCPKEAGIDMALRTLGPGCIAVDEITSEQDCKSLSAACWCGVELLATAHAAGCADLWHREIYRPLVETGVFSRALVLSRDRSWHLEEVAQCTSR